MSIMVGMGKGAQNGILIRDAEALETFEKVDTVVVDKTGTLTEGKPALVDVTPPPGMKTPCWRWLLLSNGRASTRWPPPSWPVRANAGLHWPAEDFQSITGEGAVAHVGGQRVAIGNDKLMRREGAFDPQWADRAGQARAEGQTVMFVAVDGKAAGLLAVADPIKASSADAVARLHKAGIRVVMLTGDAEATARAVAARLGIDEVHANVSPEDKHRVIGELKAAGHVVAMAGDGINDAPALAAADVGVAMGTGTDIAMESARVTLVSGDLAGLAKAQRLSRLTMRNIRQNLLFAFGYNALGVPVAAGVLYPAFGLLLSPMLAAAAMSLSSVSVIGNALRLRRTAL